MRAKKTMKIEIKVKFPYSVNKARFPEFVPILSAKDFVKHSSVRGEKQCLLIRTCDVFGEYFSAKQIAIRIMHEVITSEIILHPRLKDVPRETSIIVFNDSDLTKEHDLARVWNRTMAAMGYTEGNPEAKNIKPIPELV